MIVKRLKVPKWIGPTFAGIGLIGAIASFTIPRIHITFTEQTKSLLDVLVMVFVAVLILGAVAYMGYKGGD